MKYKKRTRRNTGGTSKWIVPLLLGISILWIVMSSIVGKSTTELLTDGYLWVMSEKSAHPSREELKGDIIDQKITIDSLQTEITALLNKSPYKKALVNIEGSSLNLRTEPSISSDVVIKIPDSSRVEVIYFDEEVLFLEGEAGKWCKIKYADKEGWVWGNYLLIED